jgi:tRNA/rRNA methyltransferase
MKNFGLQKLVLVNPQCDVHSLEAIHMAVRGVEILHQAQVVETIPQALVGCYRAIATAGRDCSLPVPRYSPSEILPWLLAPIDSACSNPIHPNPAHPNPASPPRDDGQSGERSPIGSSAALIFGREDRGLTNQELHYGQHLLQIPSNPTYPSLNLAQAVGICCYELYRLQAQLLPEQLLPEQLSQAQPLPGQSLSGRPLAIEQDGIVPPPQIPTPFTAQLNHGDGPADELNSGMEKPGPTTASLDNLQRYYDHLEKLLLSIGYLLPHTAPSRMQKFRRLYNRASLSPQELSMLRGILRQMEWALRDARDHSPPDPSG